MRLVFFRQLKSVTEVLTHC